MGTDSVWLIFSARVIVDSAARVSRSVFPSLSLLLLCRDNGGLESARARACARSAVASADCGMRVSAAHCETRGSSTSMQRTVVHTGPSGNAGAIVGAALLAVRLHLCTQSWHGRRRTATLRRQAAEHLAYSEVWRFPLPPSRILGLCTLLYAASALLFPS